ncbi:glycosyltransferase [Paenibacillaceae bacterium WGS1546]|uniref:glycosyltransferase n=1 Tax=Cohnella sp. WGS1546 TaxID=3366810 RepID=UPI00372D046A
MRIALAVIARNEEKNIGRCLSSVNWVDEVIVVDTGSTDRTREIAERHGAEVYDFVWCDDFSRARNYSIERASADWILVLDADEWVESVDIEAVRAFIESPRTIGRIVMLNDMEDEKGHSRAYITRLFPRHLRYSGAIHEQVDSDYVPMNVPIVVRHDGYLKQTKAERNIPLLRIEIDKNPTDPYYHYQLAKEYRGIESWSFSIECFEKAIRALTGRERYAPNVVVDYLYVLLKAKQYERGLELIQREYLWLRRFPDYYFVCGLFYLDASIQDPARASSYLPLIESNYLRCLEIGETDEYDSVVGTGSFAALYNLGNFYEVLGQSEEAIRRYRQSADMGYRKARNRLQAMLRSDSRDHDA